jgi:hypothetical protein
LDRGIGLRTTDEGEKKQREEGIFHGPVSFALAIRLPGTEGEKQSRTGGNISFNLITNRLEV